MIVHHGSRLSMSRNRATIKTIVITIIHKIHRVFHNNIFAVKAVGAQCQPMNQNYFEPNPIYNSSYSGFDQPPQYSINHQEDLNQQRINDVHNGWDKIDELQNELFLMIQSFCEKFLQQKQAASIDQSPLQEMSLQEMEDLKQHYLDEMLSLKPSRRFNYFYDDDDEESSIPLRDIISKLPPSIAITLVLPTLEPKDSLIMGDEHLSTIPEKESDELIKSSVEDLVPILSESKDTSRSDSECDLPSCDDFSPIKVYEEKSMTFSNPLFDSNDDFTSIDDESLSIRHKRIENCAKTGIIGSTRVVSSDEASLGDQEDASKQERKIHDIDADEDITLENVHDHDIMFDVSDLAGEEVFVAEQGVPNNKKDDAAQVNTTTVSTASTIPVSAATITEDEITLPQALVELKSAKPTTAASTRPKAKGLVIHEEEQATTPTISSQQPSQVKVQDKGKGILVEEPVKSIKKKDQIRLDEELAFKLQAEKEEEERLAREKVEASVALTDEWNDIQAKIEGDQLIAERLQPREQEELTIKERAKLFQQLLEKRRKFFAAKRAEENRNKPQTRAQQRSIMCTYLKNMVGWKPKDLKSKSFTNIRELFGKAFKRVNTFVDFRTELVEGSEVRIEGSETRKESSSKRAGDELEQENAKKQKVDDDQEATKMKELMKIVPDKEEVAVDAMPLATKPPSIVDWKIVKEGKISYYHKS
ncbi:hypothetical protein Tco_0780474 [Tanacetum coccineum]